MAKENTAEKGAKSAEMSEADAILEFLPDAAEALRTEKPETGNLKAEKADKETETEESEAETETEEADEAGDDQADAEDADEEEATEDEKPAGSEKVQKRIDKLTARAKTAEEKVAEVEAELEKVRAESEELRKAGPQVVSAPSADNPLSDVSSPAELTTRVNGAVALKRWCIENPDGGTVKNKEGEDVEFEPAQVRKMLADMEEIITVHAPRRERYLAESETNGKVAREVYPEMFKTGSEMEKAFQQLVKAWPEVTRFPDYQLVLGDYIAGFKARSGKKPVVEKKKPAIAPPVPKVSATKTTSATKGPKLEHVLAAGATEDALTNYFAA